MVEKSQKLKADNSLSGGPILQLQQVESFFESQGHYCEKVLDNEMQLAETMLSIVTEHRQCLDTSTDESDAAAMATSFVVNLIKAITLADKQSTMLEEMLLDENQPSIQDQKAIVAKIQKFLEARIKKLSKLQQSVHWPHGVIDQLATAKENQVLIINSLDKAEMPQIPAGGGQNQGASNAAKQREITEL